MKRLLVIAVFILSATSLAFAAPAKKIQIGVSIANFDDTFLTYMMDEMRAYAKEHSAEVELTFADAKEDMAKQLDQVENFIIEKKDAIIIVPVDTTATAPMTKSITSKKIKLVYVNRNPGNLPEGVYFVGVDEALAGRLQMEYLVKKLGGKGNVVVLMGKLDNESTLKRTQGVEEVASKNPGIKILDKQTGLWQRSEGMVKSEDWINRFGKELNGIASNNDDMALGAIQAIKDKRRTDIAVVGVDATPDGMNAIAKGELAASVLQDPKAQGRGGVEIALKAVRGEKLPGETIISPVLVSPENLSQFKK